MSEELTMEDIAPETAALAGENKAVKKLMKLGDKILAKLNGAIKADRDMVRKKLDGALDTVQKNIDNFVKSTNEDLERFKKRYEAMYTDLVRRILVQMEGRVFSAEIFEQATLDLFVEKLFRFENNLKPEDEIDHIAYQAYIEDCAALHEKFMQKHVNAYVEKQKEKANVATQKEESKTKDSGRGEDQGSCEDNQENSGASTEQVSQPTESTPIEAQP